MTKNDWYEAGEQIRDLVQDAIDTRDFSQLNGAINNVVDHAMDGLETALREGLNQGAQNRNGKGQNEKASDSGRDDFGEKYSQGQKTVRFSRTQGADRIRRNMEEKKVSYRPVKKRLKAPGEISGKVMAVSGYGVGGMLGLALAILGVAGLGTGVSVAVPGGILGILFAAFMCLGISGSRKAGLAKRFRRYSELLGNRTFCLVEELASGIGESCGFVRKDLKKMIRRGFFPQGYLDQKGTCLITDQSTYQQYLAAQESYVVREMQAEKEKKAEKSREKKEEEKKSWDKADVEQLTPECRELIEEGRKYIRHIRQCNDRIADRNMSDKLDRLETVTARIFTEAEKNPEVVDDLKKMMSYYLPTTKKLLDAYCELDVQPVQGQNIVSTKKEIETALDTINEAFANLLDSLFEDKAWDISSDISVLHTMLAQEGLTGSDFERKTGNPA